MTLVNDQTKSRQTYNPVTGEISNYPWTTNEARPFLPGYIAPDIDGYAELGNSMFIPDKTAGVDSAGLLLGSLSMAGLPIQSRNNTDIAELMDRYIKMNDPTLSGTDAQGRPVFYAFNSETDQNSILENSALRLTRGDIERSTFLLSDLSQIRAGDLLVSSNTYGEMEIAIVTEKTATTETSLEGIMESVKIITVNIDTGYVKEGLWTDGETLNCSPESYQPRRLVVVDEEYRGMGSDRDGSETSETMPTDQLSAFFNLTYKIIDIKGNDYWHWVPNTEVAEGVPNRGEPFKVKFKLVPNENYPLNGSALIPSESSLCNYFIVIMGKDLNYDSAKSSDTSNIYNNSDTADFILSAMFPEVKDVYTFNYNSQNQEIFSTDREQSMEITISENMELEVKDNTGRKTRCFTVRSRNAIPGDNIYLSFFAGYTGRNRDGVVSSDDLQTDNLTDKQNFFTLYDHKLLWRANLYVDENHYPSLVPSQYHVQDWNDLHPWVYGNDWNKEYAGTARLNTSNIEPTESAYLSTLPEGNGGQVVKIQPFTYCPEILAGNGKYAVAYSYGDHDSPFEFNDELYQQMECVRSYHQAQVDSYCTANGITQDAIDVSSLPENSTIKTSLIYLSHDETTAPGGEWAYESYIYPSEMFPTLNDIEDYPSVPTVIGERGKILAFPFLPGWNLNFHLKYGGTDTPDWTNVISSGVDCVGLVQRAASYYLSNTDHNFYAWNDIYGHDLYTRQTGDDHAEKLEDWWDNNKEFPTVASELSWVITDSNQLGDFGGIGNINNVCPGDIFLQPGHIAIVNKIVDSDNDGIIKPEEVQLIEATWGPKENWARVVTSDTNPENDGSTLAFYGSWSIVRLR